MLLKLDHVDTFYGQIHILQGVSLEVAALTSLVATALGTLIALALVRYGFRGRGTTNLMIFLPMSSPEIVLGASLLTLSYLGALRAVPGYNTMGLAKASLEASVRYLAASLGPRGVRVNGISAGPIKTLAASGIKGFGKILEVVASNSPLRRNVTVDDVGNVAAFLLSDLASAVTGEITYVDCGFSIVAAGMGEE